MPKRIEARYPSRMDTKTNHPKLTAEDEPLFDKRYAAQQLKLCIKSLENLMKARAISYLKIGKSVRFARSDIQRFKESRTVKAVA